MKLTSARVTNFRSVEDSGEFTTPHTTCFVGKNEAGKTAVLLALASLNPHRPTPCILGRERDYPRRSLTKYDSHHPEGPATVVRTVWELERPETELIEAEFGQGVLLGNSVTVSRRYETDAPTWEQVPIDWRTAFANLMKDAKLSAPERSPLKRASTSDELRDLLRALGNPTPKQAALLAGRGRSGPPGSRL